MVLRSKEIEWNVMCSLMDGRIRTVSGVTLPYRPSELIFERWGAREEVGNAVVAKVRQDMELIGSKFTEKISDKTRDKPTIKRIMEQL